MRHSDYVRLTLRKAKDASAGTKADRRHLVAQTEMRTFDGTICKYF